MALFHISFFCIFITLCITSACGSQVHGSYICHNDICIDQWVNKCDPLSTLDLHDTHFGMRIYEAIIIISHTKQLVAIVRIQSKFRSILNYHRSLQIIASYTHCIINLSVIICEIHSKSWIFGSSETKQSIASGGLHPTLLQKSTIGIDHTCKTSYPQNKY